MVDEIYAEKDPIAASLGKRKSAGTVTTVVRDLTAPKTGRFFFVLRVKAQAEAASAPPKDTSVIRKPLTSRPVQHPHKPQPKPSTQSNQRASSIPKINGNVSHRGPRAVRDTSQSKIPQVRGSSTKRQESENTRGESAQILKEAYI